MENILEIIGIALQLLAGFVFILKQVAKKLVEKIGGLLRKYLAVISGEPRRRWKIAFVGALITLPIFIAVIFIWGSSTSGEAIPLSAIGGAAIFILFGWYSYLSSLRGSERLLDKWKVAKRRVGRDHSRVMLFSNVFLFLISIMLLLFFVYSYNLYLSSSQNLVWQLFMGLYILVASLAAAPVFLLSFMYLAVLASQNSLYFLQGMSAGKFWVVLLALWTLGGILLLLNACLY